MVQDRRVTPVTLVLRAMVAVAAVALKHCPLQILVGLGIRLLMQVGTEGTGTGPPVAAAVAGYRGTVVLEIPDVEATWVVQEIPEMQGQQGELPRALDIIL